MAWPNEVSFHLQDSEVGGGEPPAPAPQPILDGLVRRLPDERRGCLVQQAITQNPRQAGQDAVTVQGEGLGIEEIDQFGSCQGQRQVTLLDRTAGLDVQGDDQQVPRCRHDGLHIRGPR